MKQTLLYLISHTTPQVTVSEGLFVLISVTKQLNRQHGKSISILKLFIVVFFVIMYLRKFIISIPNSIKDKFLFFNVVFFSIKIN